MGRRFPPPLFGLERAPRRCHAFTTIVSREEQPLENAELVSRARETLTKPDGGQYSESYLRRMVSTYVQLGVLRETGTELTVYQFARDWLDGEIDFETFLWYAVKQSWALEGTFPEGIEGLYHIHHAVNRSDAPLSQPEVRDRLAADYDYEFNKEGIRGYPQLLKHMGALKETDDGFQTVAPDRFANRFRNVDVRWQLERWMKREGPNNELPSDRVKRDLAKYYMYRESGGHGRHRGLIETARSDFVDDSVLTDTSRPKLKRSSKYVEQRRKRRTLRERICDRFRGFEPRDLAGLSTNVLERIAAAEDETEAFRMKSGTGNGFSRIDLEELLDSNRPSYTLPDHFSLYDWQREAVDEWFEDGTTTPERGIAQVVTGAGKTVMALGVIRQWLEEHPDGVVTVVVPTKVLMNQWLAEMVEKLAVPVDEIGWLGDGTKDGFEGDRRILVSIVNSAVKDDYLAKALVRAQVDEHLLVADECHRYTGDSFSNVFDYPRTASLGLSATPLSEPGTDDRTPEDELLLSELGDIYYDLSYDEGHERGLIPEFRINYVGFELTDAERTAYDRLTDAIVDAVSEIERRYQSQLYELDGNFSQSLQVIKESVDGPSPAIGDFFRYTQERRELVADAVARQAVTLRLLEETVETGKKSIVFQERIEQLERMVAPRETRGRDNQTGEIVDTDVERAKLYEQYPELEEIDRQLEDLFFTPGYRPVMYHSGHRNDVWNDFAIEWFGDDGFANVMLSVKALIEGVDVPSADVGIVRVSSGSVRQRIQTLGRILRTGENPNRQSELYVLYARDTVDANIFDRYDWRSELDRADIRHLTWETGEDTIEGELRAASKDEIPDPPKEVTIPDTDDLSRGDHYDGPCEGYQFSVDAEGRPFEKTIDGHRYIADESYHKVAEYIHRTKGGGSVVVNEANHALTYLDDEFVFVGTVSDPGDVMYSEEESSGLTDPSDFSIDEF